MKSLTIGKAKLKAYNQIQKYGPEANEIYVYLMQKQKGLCGICGQRNIGGKEKKEISLCIDHCAETGKIRGLLCGKCNRVLGFMQHDPKLLIKAAMYLRLSRIES
jgi:hypothetical protein